MLNTDFFENFEEISISNKPMSLYDKLPYSVSESSNSDENQFQLYLNFFNF